jgi:hypothetical protein
MRKATILLQIGAVSLIAVSAASCQKDAPEKQHRTAQSRRSDQPTTQVLGTRIDDIWAKLEQLRPGMTKAQVARVLGGKTNDGSPPPFGALRLPILETSETTTVDGRPATILRVYAAHLDFTEDYTLAGVRYELLNTYLASAATSDELLDISRRLHTAPATEPGPFGGSGPATPPEAPPSAETTREIPK